MRRRSAGRRFDPGPWGALLASALALGACAQEPGGPARGMVPSGDAGPAAVAEDTAPPAPLIADPARDRERPALAALPPDLPEVSDDPDQFIGLDGLAVARRLGAPTLVRRDGPAEVWLYRGRDCMVDVFLYADDEAEGAGLVTRYVDLRSPAKSAAEARQCLGEMLQAEALRRRGT